MKKKERCGDCYYWDAPDIAAAFNGDCTRYPQTVPKHCDQSCGEFKPRKLVEMLREGKKNETNP